MHRRLRVVVPAIALGITGCAQSPAAGDRAGCAAGAWTAGAPLGGDSLSILARFPAMAIDSSGTVVVAGTRVALAGDIAPRGDWLELRRGDGQRIPRPPGDFLFLYPRLLAGRGGSFTMVWGEPAPGWTAANAWEMMVKPAETIWAAVYEPVQGWGKPFQLYSGAVEWSGFFVDQAVANEQGDGLTIVAPKDLLRGGELVQLFIAGGRARSRDITQMAVVQPTAARLGDRLFVAYLAGAAGVANDVSSVFVMSSRDDGISWTTPRMVARSGEKGANEVKVRVGPGGVLHMVWKPGDARVLRHVVSRDSGATWAPPDDVPTPDDASNLRTAVDACARLHVVFETTRATGSLAHVVWDGRWSVPQALIPDRHAADAALVADPTGGVQLVANVGNAGGGTETDRLYLVRWR